MLENRELTKSDWFFGTLILICVVFFGFWIVNVVYQEIRFSYSPSYIVECELLSINHSPSTLRSRVAPIISTNGDMSTVVYQTGDPEKTITVWQCGKFGRLACDKKKVWQYAQERSFLEIKSNDYDTRIVDIVVDWESG